MNENFLLKNQRPLVYRVGNVDDIFDDSSESSSFDVADFLVISKYRTVLKINLAVTMKSSTPTVNMDFNSTTPMNPAVIKAVHEACIDLWTNPSSGYATGCQAKKMIGESRHQVAKMINGAVDEIIFTSGGTESNNWLIYSSVDNFNRDGTSNLDSNRVPHIITTNIEHDSVRLILEKLLSDGKIEVTFVEVSKATGSVSAEDIIDAIRPNTVLITVMLANNETGILQPVTRISELLATVNERRLGKEIYLHTDASQAVGKIKVDVTVLGVDYLTIVGHKFYAPRIGALYRKSLTPLHPIFFGGGQENGLRPGTENTPMIVGLGVAARLVCDNIDQYEKHMTSLRQDMESKLIGRFGSLVTINGQHCNACGRLPNTISLTFNDPKLNGSTILGQCKALRACVGAACHSGQLKPSAVLIASGVDRSLASCTIRLSLGRESKESDIEIAISELGTAVKSILELS